MLVAIVVTACGGANLTVVKSAGKTAYAGQKNFSAHPIIITNLQVDGKPEAEFLARKSPKFMSGWEADKSSLDGNFQKSLPERALKSGITITSGDAAPFIIHPSISWIETGYYRIPAWNAISRIKMNVTITDSKGVLLEELNMEDKLHMDVMLAPDSGGRLRGIARMLGSRLANYLKTQTSP
jgi:hypothetical protein